MGRELSRCVMGLVLNKRQLSYLKHNKPQLWNCAIEAAGRGVWIKNLVPKEKIKALVTAAQAAQLAAQAADCRTRLCLASLIVVKRALIKTELVVYATLTSRRTRHSSVPFYAADVNTSGF
ncbi:MAG: hypothetical protein ACKESB_00990 [Candidatus Hodgkinia cicadicola]